MALLRRGRLLKLSSAVLPPHGAAAAPRRRRAAAAHGSAVWRHRVKVAGAVHHSIVAVLDLVILKDGLLSLAKLYFHCYLVSGLEYEVTYCECANI